MCKILPCLCRVENCFLMFLLLLIDFYFVLSSFFILFLCSQPGISGGHADARCTAGSWTP